MEIFIINNERKQINEKNNIKAYFAKTIMNPYKNSSISKWKVHNLSKHGNLP